jgi:membrane-associated phospholipid phosphatase
MTEVQGRSRWATYGKWFVIVSLVFGAVYPLCNWVTHQHGHTLGLYLPIELRIPFRPTFVWVYLSMYLLFFTPPFLLDAKGLDRLGRRLVKGTWISGAIFLLLPTHLGFPRVAPVDPLLRGLYERIFAIDLPHNMVPSLHVVYSGLILMAYSKDGIRPQLSGAWWLWLSFICASTLLVHQHHVLDVVSGLGLAILLNKPTARERRHAGVPAPS